MNTTITTTLSQLEFGDLQRCEHVAVLPLLAPEAGPAYITLTDALGAGLVTITELTNGGSVPELKAVNRGKLPVLLLDGEEIAGAKQNRALNTAVLLKELGETIIPVSCTEHGRWSYTSPEFHDSGAVMARGVRTVNHQSVTSALERSHSFRSDQGAVWDGIAALSDRASVASPTSAMRDVFLASQDDLGRYLAAFPCVPQQAGLLVFVHGAVVGCDLVSRHTAYQTLHAKLLQSYLLDPLVEQGRSRGRPTTNQAKAFLQAVTTSTVKVYPGVGYGEDHRLTSPIILGSALIYSGAVIHLALFQTKEPTSESGIVGRSQRRRFRT